MSTARGDSAALVAVPSQTVGPFFHFGLTPDGVVHAVPLPDGVPRLELTIRVTDGQGQLVPDAMIEIWYAAEPPDGVARNSRANDPSLFARLPTGADGQCTFEIARPAGLSSPAGGRPAAHVNVCVFARGLLRHLQTRVYFAGDPALEADAVLALVPRDRRATLLASPDRSREDRWVFDLRLQGADETVFFDV